MFSIIINTLGGSARSRVVAPCDWSPAYYILEGNPPSRTHTTSFCTSRPLARQRIHNTACMRPSVWFSALPVHLACCQVPFQIIERAWQIEILPKPRNLMSTARCPRRPLLDCVVGQRRHCSCLRVSVSHILQSARHFGDSQFRSGTRRPEFLWMRNTQTRPSRKVAKETFTQWRSTLNYGPCCRYTVYWECIKAYLNITVTAISLTVVKRRENSKLKLGQRGLTRGILAKLHTWENTELFNFKIKN
jgi:hypothetical protein